MSKTATLSAAIVVSGEGQDGQEQIGPFTLASSPGQWQLPLLSSGFQNVSIGGSATPKGVLVNVRPANGGMAPILKGVTGDLGVPISDKFPSFVPLNNAPIGGNAGTIGLTVSVAGQIQLVWV